MARKTKSHWTGLLPYPERFWGFIYQIIDLDTGQFYIGKKQYWVKKPKAKGCKTAVTAPKSERWKLECWRESNWRTYSGSSQRWSEHMTKNSDHKFVHQIIAQAPSKGWLTYLETVAIVRSYAQLSSKGFNLWFSAIKFRPDLRMLRFCQFNPIFDWGKIKGVK